MKIILPEFGAYRTTEDGAVMVSPWIYVESNEKQIFVAIPPPMQSCVGKFDPDAPPTNTGYRKATYVRTEEPNCAGIARFELKGLE